MQAAIQQNSTDFDTNSPLSPAQVQVAAALAQGRTVSAAALHAGVHRTTIYVWLQREPEFKTAIQDALREYIDTMNDELRDLSSAALLLENPETPDWIPVENRPRRSPSPAIPQAGLESARARRFAARGASHRRHRGHGTIYAIEVAAAHTCVDSLPALSRLSRQHQR